MKKLLKKAMIFALVAAVLLAMALPVFAAQTTGKAGSDFPCVETLSATAVGERMISVRAAEENVSFSWIGIIIPIVIVLVIAGGVALGGLSFVAASVFIACVWILLAFSLKKSKKLDSAMQNIVANPCQQTAEAAVAAFSNINALLRFNLGSSGDRSGVHFSMWREVFNHTVIPCKNIKSETKEALRQALVRLNTRGLYPVTYEQTPEQVKEATDAFGEGGEENVWHNLKFLQGCDVYRNVRIHNGDTKSEIDAVIVDANKGIFLLEVKSDGGDRAPNGLKVISYHKLEKEPSNQIYRHEYDFLTCFAGMGIEGKIKNVLLFSWPDHEERRILDRSTLPKTDFDIITIEELIRYHRAQPSNALSDSQRSMLAEKLKSCSSKYVAR